MSGPDSQCPYYDIHVKNPPQLPSTFKNSDGVDQPTLWDQHARNFVARYNQNGTDFDAALENSHTAQWPYHLGSTIQGPEVPALIRKWGLQMLEAAGFVNHEPEVGEMYTDPIGRLAKTRNPLDEPEKQIHPVLRREMFAFITDEDYELMQPALLLASAILDDPTTLHFFYAVSHPAQHSWITNPKLDKCRIVTVPATLKKAQQIATIKKITDMRSWTSWEINDHEYFRDNIALAVTDTRIPPYHTSSSVE
jgi:DNA-directed RNA polymerase subunit L